MCPLGMWRPLVAYMRSHLEHCFLVLGAIFFWCCVFGAMHCQLYCAGLLLQWRIYFIYLTFCWGIFTKHCTFENGRCPICLTGHIGGGYISIRCIYSDLCSYFIGGCINSRHTGHSSWSLTKIYCITNTQIYWVKNVKKKRDGNHKYMYWEKRNFTFMLDNVQCTMDRLDNVKWTRTLTIVQWT